MVAQTSVSSGLGSVVLGALEAHDIDFGAYVADHLLSGVAEELHRSEDFTLLTATREDEGLGVLAGAYVGGRRGVMLMQSSGFGLCVNALASFILPYQIPIPMFVGLRGDLGEFNIAQIPGGQAVGPICQSLGIPYEAPSTLDELSEVLPGLLTTCLSTERPICVGIRRSLR